MKRFLNNAITVVSLVLCLATAVLWVRSYDDWDYLWYARPSSSSGRTWGFSALSASGRASLLVRLYPKELTLVLGLHCGSDINFRDVQYDPMWEIDAGVIGWQTFGLKFDPNSGAVISIPHWALAALLATLPGLRGFNWWRRRRHPPPGHCQKCGYDLRATPDRCPECGTAPVKLPAASILPEALP